MRQQYKVVCLLLLFVSGFQTQDPSSTTPFDDWNGDPKICTVNPVTTTTPSPTPPSSFPKFTNQAEFSLERVIIRHRLNATAPSELTLYHYTYDYDNNTLVLVEYINGTVNLEFYDYDVLKKTTYNRGDTCVATDIPVNNDLDGRSATGTGNGTWHIRPMNEFLLFSSDEPDRRVTPVYVGTDVIRGIPVDTWRTCYINRVQFRTVQRIWSFAQRGVSMPSGVVGEFAVPIQAIINASVVGPDNIQLLEFDEIFNVLSYRTSLMEPTNQITPTKGVYCDDVPQEQLVSLKDVGISWPYRFDVRIEASTSRSAVWQAFHLYYHQGDDTSSSRLRYDYLPQGSENYQSVIHDYTDNLTYIIDRQVGTCKINRGVEIPDVNPLVDPIRFFIKNEAIFIFSPRENAWENKGSRTCRTGSISCTVLTTSVENFPAMIESDTGAPTGDTWQKTNIEYAWANRAPNARPSGNASQRLDYPVSLYLKMYRNPDPNNPSAAVRIDDVEYEFYEMAHDANLNRFDTSTCYRALSYEYLHLAFTLKLNRGDIIDGNHLNRRRLDNDVHYNLINRMQIRYARVTNLEIDHESVSNDVMVFFTILGRTPNPEAESGFTDDEPTAAQARDIIQQVIDDGQFEFNLRLDDDSEVQFRAQPGSLKTSKQYMSTHASGKPVVIESYTTTSQVIAIVVGALAGLIVGIAIAAIIRIVQKKPMPSLPSSISNPLPTINFHAKKPAETTSDA